MADTKFTLLEHVSQVKINIFFLRKIVNIFLSIISSICFGCSKKRLIEGAQMNRLI